MKISVVISACDNREHLFDRSLFTWNKQTLNKNEWELIVVDDDVRDSVREQCRNANKIYGINVRYIRIDKSKSFYKVKTFTPALTNNVGFKKSRGNVICVTGPETLQGWNNLENAYKVLNRKVCAYGLVYKASISATKTFENNWNLLKNKDIPVIWDEVPGAKAGCVTKPPDPPRYWYFMAVAKKHINAIHGVDERFVGGLCAEDDDFATRMNLYGVTPIFEHSMTGIHQDHSIEDKDDNIHINRFTKNGNYLRSCNVRLWKQNMRNKICIVNNNHEWGSDDLITVDEEFFI